MPFLAIILDSDIILGSFLSNIIKMHAFWQKPFSKKEKGPCQEAYKQSFGVGKHPQMVPFSNPGVGQKMTFAKSLEKVPTNTAN